ncbi:LOW QUALITY PROTEIN: hypothetical protein PHMEG_00019597 [Phytophthora megakarya]|uniref:Uncharacterized protein n=1 Tax=Phytophthora megakarya TaxID=4795 RepID=A0A225VTS2_9STRA|nr:LOW QUALITY PROTEIN: hypothetical protein PHMEG_00019597 [Phytophthora megakarya]
MMRKKLPPRSKRYLDTFWSSTGNTAMDETYPTESQNPCNDSPGLATECYQRVTTLRLILLNRVMATICGAQEAPGFLKLFLSWINPLEVASATTLQHQQSCLSLRNVGHLSGGVYVL